MGSVGEGAESYAKASGSPSGLSVFTGEKDMGPSER